MERGFIGRSEKKGLADGEVYNGSDEKSEV